MTPPPPGVILPCRGQLERADAHAELMKLRALDKARQECQGLAFRRVQGEPRYYMSPTVYTPAQAHVRRWFEVREDGDYAISEARAMEIASGGAE